MHPSVTPDSPRREIQAPDIHALADERQVISSITRLATVDGALGWWAAVSVHRAGKPIRICGVGSSLSIMVCCTWC